MLQYGKCIIIMRKIYVYLALMAYLIFGFYIYYVYLITPIEQAKNLLVHDKALEKCN